ncbi:G-D-S-L family lipolytic protein [Phormidium sp. FACHB-592]|uniref:GDSL-type esterase/lipase family protein n=1 Tax=Stenomitos frigidus AS-A4 TaxID=2933935 RepID=A0ABV0KTK3_9CYAN|nr:GDSL-type esterase/lipase family protein [Phormidium sp. FACHB-592]MBD2078276.1 G-D-S-L family lipolytic protein [Phormidium sp. FACHB-592]
MRNGRAFWVGMVAVLVLAVWQVGAAPRPVHILPLGDSITQGGRTDREEYTYRLPLQRLLIEAGVPFVFIGSMRTGLQPEATWPAVAPGVQFDRHHEGHYGWKTAAVRDQLATWLPLYACPDIVLIHLGTNDQEAANSTANAVEAKALLTQAIVAPLEDIIGILRTRNPKVLILVGHLNFDSDTARQIRSLVESMASRLSTPASPIRTVPHYLGFRAAPGPGSDTFDWAHPNPQGQQKMALAWFKAMKSYLPLCSTPVPKGQ